LQTILKLLLLKYKKSFAFFVQYFLRKASDLKNIRNFNSEIHKKPMKEAAEKEIKKMQPVIDSLKMENEEASELFKMTHSYFSDAKYFFEKGKFVEAFEAAVIAWAYVDAGLHLRLFSVDKSLMNFFTV